MRLVRTDEWDDSTRGEWDDIKRWGRRLIVAVAFTLAGIAARLVTASYLEALGIAAIVGIVSGRLEKRRSRIDQARTHSDRST